MKKTFFIGFVVLMAAVLGLRGNILPTLDSVTPEGSNFRWSYTANVTDDQAVQTGDFFTIYDFGNLIVGSNQQPPDWSFTSLLIGVTPPTVLPQDNRNVFNLTWTYIGTAPITGPAFLGTFSALSSTDQRRVDFFASRATRSTGPLTGTKIDNIGLAQVPVPEMSALSPIIGLCGLGALGYFGSLFRRRTS